MIFHAVRGVHTLHHLRELGLVEPEESVTLGDPGLLYADIVPGVKETRKEFDVAVVPHHVDAEEFKAVVDWLSSAGLSVKFVDVSDSNPMQVVRDIAASRKVLSSSLHGIIVADSLGIPNLRVVADGFEEDEKRMLNESHLKFSDYYSAFGLERPKHIYLSELKNAPRRTVDRIVDFVPRDKVEKCKRELLDAFPFPKRAAVSVVREEQPLPGVSVIVPVYNAEYYLRECLDSVLLLAQFTALELICIDDGSADDSAAILEFWKDRDPRLHVIRQKNQGPGVARNAGLAAAKGEFIFFLDADDRLSSGAALRQAYEQAKADDLDVLIADGSVMDEQGLVDAQKTYLRKSLVPEGRVFGPEAFGANLYLVSPMSPWAKLYRRSFVLENKLSFPALRRSEDFPFVQLALSLAHRLGVKPIPLIERRIGVATSLETTKDETPLIFIDAERMFREELD
ncbi:MAG: glycosyltransferase, partial [Kiritimatiellae bacterium]|nr:glycosyltransferase [Kiritimatiellia bacterium]